MNTLNKMESQKTALEKALISGKCKNPYAVKNKIRNLYKEIRHFKHYQFLAQ